MEAAIGKSIYGWIKSLKRRWRLYKNYDGQPGNNYRFESESGIDYQKLIDQFGCRI